MSKYQVWVFGSDCPAGKRCVKDGDVFRGTLREAEAICDKLSSTFPQNRYHIFAAEDAAVPQADGDGGALPSAAAERKKFPVAIGVLDYFPRTMVALAEVSRKGSEQHHPGEPLHWDRSKSTDHADCLIRHFLDRGKIDTDDVRHSVKVAWRALALAELELEQEES